MIRFSGVTAPGYLVALVALIVVLAAVLYVIELRAAGRRR